MLSDTSLEDAILSTPVTCLTILLQLLIFLYLYNYNTPYDRIAYQYDAIVAKHEYWRVYTASYSHLSFIHLAFNMMSIWNLRLLESQIFGSAGYLAVSLLLVNGSMLTMLIIHRLQIRYGSPETEHSTREGYSIGYSCVVFGLMCVLVPYIGWKTQYDLFGLQFPYVLAPFVSLVITQLIVANASFIGHAAGIVIGYIMAATFYVGGAPYIANVITAAVVGVISVLIYAISLHRTTDYKIPLVEYMQCRGNADGGNAPSRVTIQNGRIVYNRVPLNDDQTNNV